MIRASGWRARSAAVAACLVAAVAGCQSGSTPAGTTPAATGPAAGAAAASRSPGPAAGTPEPTTGNAVQLSRIRHVWVIELENSSFATSFGDPAADPELARALPAAGALLTNYYAIGHDSLDNYIAEISGQAPDGQTGADCGSFTRFVSSGRLTSDGQLPGDGCVYPASVPTVANQLTAAGLTWKSYSQQMGADPQRDGTTMTAVGPACGHPAIGAADQTDVSHPADDSYATRHDPFVYFESIIGSPAYCAAHVVSLQPLSADLASAAATPAYSWITPDTCADGHDATCQNGAAGGLGQADSFLGTWVPRIMASAAYRQGGLIVITADESDDADATACCGELGGQGDPSHPNASEPGLLGAGGGRVGAVLLSPYIRPGTVSSVRYNHYSLLKTMEEILGLPLLGDARQPQVLAFGADVFTRLGI